MMYVNGAGLAGDIFGSGNDSNGANSEAPSLNLAGDRKTATLVALLSAAAMMNSNSKYTSKLYDELQKHLQNEEKVDSIWDKISSWLGSDSGSGSVSESGSGSLSDSSDPFSNVEDNLLGYFQGLFTNQGKENELNRVYNSAEALANREFQSVEARKQREWYEAMSNTAYQRAVVDMQKAGINPILAYAQGGAASSGTGLPSSSAASYNSTGGDTVSSLLTAMADVIWAISGASASKISTAFKMFRMAGG